MSRFVRWRGQLGHTKTVLGEKVREALASVLPITAIVLALCFTLSPVPVDVLLAFLAGAVLLIIGMGFLNSCADSMWICVNGYTCLVLRHIIKKQEQLLSALQGGLNL